MYIINTKITLISGSKSGSVLLSILITHSDTNKKYGVDQY